MTPTAPLPSPESRPSGRRRVVQSASIGLAAGLIGSGIVVGITHATGSSASSGASASTPAQSTPSGSGSSSYGGSYGGYPGSGFGGGVTGGSSGSGTSSGGSTASSPTPGAGAPSDVASIGAKVAPGLVDINSTFNYQSEAGAGTGIVLTSDGEVITNNHVVNGATSISVTDIGNGKTYRATVVGYDDSDDVAVLQLQDASGLTTASVGDSNTASVGEPIVAIGNAGGTGGTPTSAGGSITGLDQSVTASDDLDGVNEQLTGMIGVNADVQPGDSGGPLVNTAGQVLGIDTAGSSGSSSVDYSSQSDVEAYAIPIDRAMAIADQIESGQGTGTIHVGATAFLGVMVQSADSQEGGLGGSTGDTSGVTLAGVVSGGAAAKAGLVEGDVITSFDGQTVTSPSDLTQLLVPLHPGDEVQIGWTDASGATHTGTVDLGSGPPA